MRVRVRVRVGVRVRGRVGDRVMVRVRVRVRVKVMVRVGLGYHIDRHTTQTNRNNIWHHNILCHVMLLILLEPWPQHIASQTPLKSRKSPFFAFSLKAPIPNNGHTPCYWSPLDQKRKSVLSCSKRKVRNV